MQDSFSSEKDTSQLICDLFNEISHSEVKQLDPLIKRFNNLLIEGFLQ